MDLLDKIEMFIGEGYGHDFDWGHGTSWDIAYEDAGRGKVKITRINSKTKKKLPKYISAGKVIDAEKLNHLEVTWELNVIRDNKALKEGKSDANDFPAKKKKDDKDSETSAEDVEKPDGEAKTAEEDGEDPYDPETDLDKEKKQKELKKKATNTSYTPPYSAS